jgi:gliding motility-associated-like protein
VQLSVEENTIQFTNLSENANTYFWSFDNLAPTSSSENPEVVFQNFTGLSSVQVSLTATNTEGCFDTYTFPLLIENNLLFFMPNAFTPDGNEFNQTFEPVFSPGFDPFNYQLSIYNRWGELLFESYDMEIGWDGTGKNGLLVTSGTYVWKILVGVTGIYDQKIFHGHVNVIR